MRSSVYSADSNPAIDKPAYRRSKTYVEDLVARGQAVRLDSHSVQLLHVIGMRSEADILAALAEDWRNEHISFLPKELHKKFGHYLRITTKQIQTPKPARIRERLDEEEQSCLTSSGVAPGGSVLFPPLPA